MLNWTVRDLATISGVHRNTVTRLEAEGVNSGHALATVVATFQKVGVIFIDENGEGPGVRLKKDFDRDAADYLAARARFQSEPEPKTQTVEDNYHMAVGILPKLGK